MTTHTSRYGFSIPQSTDPTNIPGDVGTALDQIDADIVMEYQGTLSAIPPAAIFGRRYYATDVGLELLDLGTSWINIGPINTTLGNIQPSVPGGSAAVGSTGLSADAGHQHAREPKAADSDIQPTGAVGVAGNSGKWVDAYHVHPGDCIGDIKANVSGISSVGWYAAIGQEVPKSGQYLAFYNACGGDSAYPWGFGSAGNPTGTTYNLPNLTDRTLVGAGGLYTVGQLFGGAATILSVSNLPTHEHPITDPGHNHGVNDPGHTHAAPTGGPPWQFVIGAALGQGNSLSAGMSGSSAGVTFTLGTGVGVTGISIQSHSTGITKTGTTVFANTAFSNIPPSAGVIYFVKVF